MDRQTDRQADRQTDGQKLGPHKHLGQAICMRGHTKEGEATEKQTLSYPLWKSFPSLLYLTRQREIK